MAAEQADSRKVDIQQAIHSALAGLSALPPPLDGIACEIQTPYDLADPLHLLQIYVWRTDDEQEQSIEAYVAGERATKLAAVDHRLTDRPWHQRHRALMDRFCTEDTKAAADAYEADLQLLADAAADVLLDLTRDGSLIRLGFSAEPTLGVIVGGDIEVDDAAVELVNTRRQV